MVIEANDSQMNSAQTLDQANTSDNWSCDELQDGAIDTSEMEPDVAKEVVSWVSTDPWKHQGVASTKNCKTLSFNQASVLFVLLCLLVMSALALVLTDWVSLSIVGGFSFVGGFALMALILAVAQFAENSLKMRSKSN